MKLTRCIPGLLLATVLLGSSLLPLLAAERSRPTNAPAPDPVITAVKVSGNFVNVAASIPPGFVRATLDSQPTTGDAGWKPRAVQRLKAKGGKVVFRIPRDAQPQNFRVRAEAQEALPAAFYKGKRTFASAPFNVGTSGGGLPNVRGTGALSADGTSANAGGSGGATTTRTVTESDIWKISGTTLYYFNQFRGLQILDLTNPDAASLKGLLPLPAVGEQMYLLDPQHVILLTRGDCSSDIGHIFVVNVGGVTPTIVASLDVPGWLQESRLVGTALYVATQTFHSDGAVSDWGTQISAFDLAIPASPVARAPLWFSGNGNVINATERLLFAAVRNATNWWQSDLHVVDISAPDGTMQELSALHPAGAVADKFKLHLAGDMLTVVSENWRAGSAGNTIGTVLETFSLADPAAPVKLGELKFAAGERLFATRFDGTRAYAVTFQRVDPLWIIDLSNPARPEIRGELEVPGWSTYIQPLGDRLVAMGLDPSLGWRAAVSLFNVADPANPALLSRVPLGDNYSWSEANSDEKAFGVFPDSGLVLVPYEGAADGSFVSRVQLIDLGKDSLTARGFIEHRFTPRRAAMYANRVVSVSGSEFLSVDASDRDQPAVRRELALAWPVDRVIVAGNFLLQVSSGDERSPSVLRVAPAGNANHLLGSLTLTNWPVVGTERRGDNLFVLQREASPVRWPVYLAASDVSGTDANSTKGTLFSLSVVDLGSLPTLSVRAQVTSTSTNEALGAAFQALWPSSDTLVWVNESSPDYIFGWGTIRPLDGVFAGAQASGVSILPIWRWWGDNIHLLAYRVSDPSAPALASEQVLADQQFRGDRSSFAANGLLFLSYATVQETPVKNAVKSRLAYAGASSLWAGRAWLQVLDYADPAAPVNRDPVNIPGLLAGVTRNGSLLFTHSLKWARGLAGADDSEQLDALAYDGVQTYLVDSLPLPSVWPNPYLIFGDTVLLNRTAADEESASLETWAVSDAGKFARLASLELPAAVNELSPVGGWVAGRSEASLLLFNLADPSAPRITATGAERGCLGYSLKYADGSPAQGIFIPLGNYGVWPIGLDAAR